MGRAINPALVEGQLRGGAAQGIGGALLEEFSYDEAGQPQAITFMEYQLPTAAEIPPIDVLLAQAAPSPGNPLGVMGAGEGGISARGRGGGERGARRAGPGRQRGAAAARPRARVPGEPGLADGRQRHRAREASCDPHA